MNVKFYKENAQGVTPAPGEVIVLLRDNNWDDWFKFETTFVLMVLTPDGRKYEIGQTKIGKKGLAPDQRRPEIPNEFSELGQEFFSLGQDESFYETLHQIDHVLASKILRSLRDCAADLSIFFENIQEEVMEESLLRYVSAETVKGRFNRLAGGNAALTPFDFTYFLPNGAEPSSIEFKVEPDSIPPSNVHALIGRNGVGKTTLMKGLRDNFFEENTSGEIGISFNTDDENGSEFVGLVSVAFSAFDDFSNAPENVRHGKKYSYIGLRADSDNGRPKSLDELAVDWVKAVRSISGSSREILYERALKTLESDPLFEDLDITDLVLSGSDAADDKFSAFFKLLSSGHKIVLLTITKLVEVVEERTLVLLDEPEAHLHPPLLSAFTRALSDLLSSRNAVAIVATHSPVILQEVPSSCVWIIERSGSLIRSQRPGIETFGENVGILTSEVFTLEVTSSGYHKLIRSLVEQDPGMSYREIIDRFGGKIGSEGRALIQALRHGVRS